jgi:hypothetical protein
LLSLPVGWHLVFVPNHLDLERLEIREGSQIFEGVAIHTVLVLYDEQLDFGE